jgi:hypothetical protein
MLMPIFSRKSHMGIFEYKISPGSGFLGKDLNFWVQSLFKSKLGSIFLKFLERPLTLMKN